MQAHDTTQRDTGALTMGLLVPGAGQLKQGEVIGALFVLIGTCFFWLSAALELVVNNMNTHPAPLHLLEELADLSAPVRVVPHVIVAVLFALTLHIGAAVLAWRKASGAASA